MDQLTRNHFNNLQSQDSELRYASFQYLIDITNHPVDWAYEVWDDLLSLIKTGDNHQRTIAVQLLSNLSKSDPENRMAKDFDQLIAVTKDEKFVTARHSLQCLWKVAIVNNEVRSKVIAGLTDRFNESTNEKNCTLIRYDILQVFRKVYDEVHDEQLKEKSLALIETEDDLKYRKKYLSVWKDVSK